MQLMSITDVGVKRKENQDNYWGAVLLVNEVETGVICLCDGMGGLHNGGLASKIVVESVRDEIKNGTCFEALKEVLQQANETIYNLGKKEGSLMGTTCTLLECSDGRYKIYHVGDSRCYRLRGAQFNPITQDHSFLKEYNVTKESNPVLWRKYKNTLTRCIGVKPEVVIDYYEGSYQKDDVFLLCSDGMWHYYENNVILREDLQDLPNLVKRCISSGETDNITAGLLFT